MFPDYYHINPLLARHPVEPRPNLDDEYQFHKVLDISPWNPAPGFNPPQPPSVVATRKKLLDRPRQRQPTIKSESVGRTRPAVIFKK
jgi:hypothetical protein